MDLTGATPALSSSKLARCRHIDLLRMKAETEGKTEDQIKSLVEDEVSKKRVEILEVSKGHLKASLARLDSSKQVIRRLISTMIVGATEVAEEQEADQEETTINSGGLNEALLTEELLASPEPSPQTDDLHHTDAPPPADSGG